MQQEPDAARELGNEVARRTLLQVTCNKQTDAPDQNRIYHGPLTDLADPLIARPRVRRSGSSEPRSAAATLWRVSYPVMVTSLAQLMLTIVDSALLGRYSTQALASIALAAPVYLVATVVVRGWATAIQILVARRHGSGQTEQVGVVVDIGLALGLALGVLMGTALLITAPALLEVIGGGTDLVDEGTEYLRILAGAVPFVAVTFALQGAFAGLGATRVAMTMALVTNIVHLPLAAALIFGAGLGVAGAGLSTLVATAAGAGYLLWYGRRRLAVQLPRLRAANLRAGRGVVPRLAGIGGPEMAMLLIGYTVEVVLFALVARLGTIELAAYRILDNLLGLSLTGIMGISTGIAILAGQHLGAGDPARAAGYHRTGARIGLLMAAGSALPLLLAPAAVLGLFTADTRVVGEASAAALAGVLGLIPMAFAFSLSGLLRAAGESRWVLLASVGSDIVLLIPLAWLFGLVLGWGLNGVFIAWIAFAAGYWALIYIRYRTGRWKTADV